MTLWPTFHLTWPSDLTWPLVSFTVWFGYFPQYDPMTFEWPCDLLFICTPGSLVYTQNPKPVALAVSEIYVFEVFILLMKYTCNCPSDLIRQNGMKCTSKHLCIIIFGILNPFTPFLKIWPFDLKLTSWPNFRLSLDNVGLHPKFQACSSTCSRDMVNWKIVQLVMTSVPRSWHFHTI